MFIDHSNFSTLQRDDHAQCVIEAAIHVLTFQVRFGFLLALVFSVAIAGLSVNCFADEAGAVADSTDESKTELTPQEEKAAERERIKAERKAEQERKRKERAAENARIRKERQAEPDRRNAERKAKQEKKQQEMAAERERKKAEQEAERQKQREVQQEKLEREMARRQEAKEKRDAERQAQIEEQEKACKRLDTLAEKLDTVPTEVLQRRFGGGIQNRQSPALKIPYESWLLSDEIFVPVFGKRYDEIATEEGTELQGTMRNCRSPTNAKGQAIMDGMLLFRAFDSRYQAGYLSGVQEIRKARDEIADISRQLEDLTGDTAGTQKWKTLADKAKYLESFAGNAQRSSLSVSLSKSYSGVVLASHARKAKQVAGKAEGIEGLRALKQLQDEFGHEASLAGMAPDWPEVARSRQAAIVQSMNKEQHRRIDGLGSGLTALENGVRWYRDYRQSFSEQMLVNDPELREPTRYFTQQRDKALAAARPELEQRIDKADNQSELEQLVSRYIPLSEDGQSTEGRALVIRVAQRREELHKWQVLGVENDRKGVSGDDLPEALSVGPSDSVMYDLLDQQLKNIAANVRSMADSCGADMQSDPVLAMMCVSGQLMEHGGGSEPMTITQFEKLGCARANGKAGYICDYLLQVRGGMQRGMGPGLAALMGQTGVGQGRFLETRDGWVAFFGEE